MKLVISICFIKNLWMLYFLSAWILGKREQFFQPVEG